MCLERATGFEPADDGLGSHCLTTWRCPHVCGFYHTPKRYSIDATDVPRFVAVETAIPIGQSNQFASDIGQTGDRSPVRQGSDCGKFARVTLCSQRRARGSGWLEA